MLGVAFPTLIAIITMFFTSMTLSPYKSFISSLILTVIILIGVLVTYLTSKFLAKTFLKGESSSFTLELPPYRKPQILKIIIRSIFDRTLFVLGRAVAVAIPAGIIIWLFANINISGYSLLKIVSDFLDPFGRLIGMDGVIILAFILGFPANEIVLPIIIMSYMSKGYMIEISDLSVLKTLLVDNGWTYITAISTMLFSLVHFPCSTTMLTIKNETKSKKWTMLAFIMPTVIGLLICFIVSNILRLF